MTGMIVIRIKKMNENSGVTRYFLTALAIFTLVSAPVFAQEESDTATQAAAETSSLTNKGRLQRMSEAALIGGPGSVGAELEEDKINAEASSRLPGIDDSLQGFVKFKKALNDKYDLSLGMRYSTYYQTASDSLTDTDDGWAGQIRAYGKWTLYRDKDDRDTGNITFLIENRHKYGSGTTPTGLSGEIGTLAPTAVSYGDNGSALTVAYWEQSFNDRASGIWIGKIDPTEVTSILGYANQRTTFSNGAVLSNLSVASPAPGFGIAGGTMMVNNFYTQGVIADANGSYDEFPFFEEGLKLYKYAEFGWMPSRTFKDRYTRNIHVGIWDQDESVASGTGPSNGFLFGTNWLIGDNLLPFFRFGKAEGEGAFVTEAVSLGALYKPDIYNDLFGIGMGWVNPADETLREETSVEMFYRYSVSRDIAVTFSAQSIFNPARNPGVSSIQLFGTRARIAF